MRGCGARRPIDNERDDIYVCIRICTRALFISYVDTRTYVSAQLVKVFPRGARLLYSSHGEHNDRAV
jgi:hypothetical protein